MANPAKHDGKREFKREEFEGIVKKLLHAPPMTAKQVHAERKGKRKLGKVLAKKEPEG